MGQMSSSSAEGRRSAYVEVEVDVESRLYGILGVRTIRGVTGGQDSKEGDNKAVVTLLVKLSPKHLGRSLLSKKRAQPSLNLLNLEISLACRTAKSSRGGIRRVYRDFENIKI